MTMESGVGFAKGRGFSRPPSAQIRAAERQNIKFAHEIVDELMKNISEMDIKPVEEDINRTVAQLCESEELLALMVDQFFSAARKDRVLCRQLAVFFGKFQDICAGDVKLRNLILNRAQKDFLSRHVIKEESDAEAINCAAFLCEIFQHMRLPNDNPLEALAVPVCAYMDDLFHPQASEDSIVEGGRQLIQNGKDIKSINDPKLAELLRSVRVMLITKPLSVPARCYLLYALEYAVSNWTVSPELAIYRDNGLKVCGRASQVSSKTASTVASFSELSVSSVNSVASEPYVKTKPRPRQPRHTNHNHEPIGAPQSFQQAEADEWGDSSKDNSFETNDFQPVETKGKIPGGKGRGFASEPPGHYRPPSLRQPEKKPPEPRAQGGRRGKESDAWGKPSKKHWYQHDDRGAEDVPLPEGGEEW